jgi:PST family polysaccharide transporter
LIIGAPLVGQFYDEPVLVPLTKVIAVTFLIGSAGIVPRARFTRAVDFRTIAIVETSAAGIGGLSAIGLALWDFGVWALAGKEIIRATVTTILFWAFASWRPSFTIRWAAIRELSSFSLNLIGDRTLNYWSRQVDDLLIGRYIGSNALGSYRMAYDIMLFPLRNVSRVISRVMFPSLSSIQDRPAKVKSVFLKVLRTIALITFPLMLGLIATTRPFVLAVFGPSWSSMIPILRILATVGLIQSLGTFNGNLFMSQGRTDLQFKLGIFVKSFRVLAIVVGLWWGVLGVTLGYALAAWVTAYPMFSYAGGLVDLSVREIVATLSAVFGVAAAMSVLVFGLGLLLPADWSSWMHLACQVPAGIAFYTTTVVLLDLPAYRELQALLASQLDAD